MVEDTSLDETDPLFPAQRQVIDSAQRGDVEANKTLIIAFFIRVESGGPIPKNVLTHIKNGLRQAWYESKRAPRHLGLVGEKPGPAKSDVFRKLEPARSLEYLVRWERQQRSEEVKIRNKEMNRSYEEAVRHVAKDCGWSVATVNAAYGQFNRDTKWRRDWPYDRYFRDVAAERAKNPNKAKN